MEDSFTTLIRTKEFLAKRFKANASEFVPVSTYKLYEYLGKDFKGKLNTLIRAGEVSWMKASYPKTLLLRAAKSGAIDLSLIKPENETLSPHLLAMKDTLQHVACHDCASAYFKFFLAHQEYANLFFTIDKFSGRVHTPITNGLKKEERKRLILKGEKTASFDVATIQPLLLADLLQFKIGNNEFTDWVFNGQDIYLKIQNKLGLSTRKEAKEHFYSILYSKPNKQAQKVFGDSNWLRLLNEIKSTQLELNPRSHIKPHTNLAFALQKTEVAFFNRCWSKMVRAGIPFLTVHDEIITRESDINAAIEIFHESFKATFKEIPYYKLNVEANNEQYVVLNPETDKIFLNRLCVEENRLMLNGYPAIWDSPESNPRLSSETEKMMQYIQEQSEVEKCLKIAQKL